MRSFKRQKLVTVPALLCIILRFLFFARSTSRIPVLDVSINRQEVIVFVKQSDSIEDVSIQREQSPFDPSTSSSQLSQLSQTNHFRAETANPKRQLSTCQVLGETN